MAITNITTPEVNVQEFKELSQDLLSTMVFGDTAPFKEMKELLEDYLDGSPDLDATQKAGIFSDFLKDAFNSVNQQAMQTANTILKENADFELQKYTVEGAYNVQLAQIPKIEAETALINSKIGESGKNIELIEADITLKNVMALEKRAVLKKQYGVQEEVSLTLGDGTKTYTQYTDSIFYAINGAGEFLHELDNGSTTATPDINGIAAKITSYDITSQMLNTQKAGAVDKQIVGYDYVNLKDTLKTMDERAALLQNAKVAETVGDKLLRVELLSTITNSEITPDENGNIVSVTPINVNCQTPCSI